LSTGARSTRLAANVGARPARRDADRGSLLGIRARALDLRSDWALVALGVAMIVSAALLLSEGRHMTFFNDEWDLILHRRGHSLAILLRPKNGHLVLVPLFIYKVLLAVFGASYTPFRVTAVAFGLLCAGLVFVFVRRRVGAAPALAAAVILLFLGVAWEELLWALGITYYLALATGIGSLLALERRDRRGDLLACGLLILSLASFSIGVAFALAATVEVCLTSEPARWRRLWLSLVPLALYGLWTLHYGQSQIVWSDLASTPFYIAETASAAMASLTGLFRMVGTAPGAVTGFPPFNVEYGQPLAVLGAILIIVRLGRAERPPVRLWTLVALTLALWISFALVAGPGRSPGASRYQYPNVLLVLLLAAEMARGVRLSTRANVLLAALVCFSLVANIANLKDGARFFSEQSEFNRAELAGLELAKATVAPGFTLEGPEAYPPAVGHYDQFVDAGSYFSFTAKFGSPADSLGELAKSSEPAREAADIVLLRAQRMSLVPVSPPPPAGAPLQAEAGTQGGRLLKKGTCLLSLPGAGTAVLVLTVPRPGLLFESSLATTSALRMRRFGTAFNGVVLGVPPALASTLTPIQDASDTPWRTMITITGAPLEVCARRPA
jgi:hypothetical protein